MFFREFVIGDPGVDPEVAATKNAFGFIECAVRVFSANEDVDFAATSIVPVNVVGFRELLDQGILDVDNCIVFSE